MAGQTGHIFLSYCSTDLRFALQIATDLKNAGVKVWMDRLDIKPGDDWRKTLEEAVDKSVGMIPIITPKYTQSKYCQRELARADRLNLPIVPLLLKSLGDSEWPMEIERAQYIDFTEWPSEEAYREHKDRLVTVLQSRFAEQISPEPDPETQYLTNLLAFLESQKGLAEYIDLATEADKWLNAEQRPEPYSSKAWAVNGPLTLLHYLPEKVASTGKLQLYPPHQRITHLQDIHEVLREHNRFVLLGGPGTGKTITLQHLLLDAALARQSKPKSAPLPFWLDLIDWDDALTLEQFIRANWPFDTDPIKLIGRGEVSLFLHGLDMLHPFKAGALRDWLHSDNAPPRVFLTCRTADYDAGRNMNLPVVQIQEMGREHIEHFATHYLGAKAAGIFLSRVFPNLGGDDKGKDYLYQFARNPFLLSALILLFKSSERGELPQNLGVLLRRLTREIWEREHLYRPSQGIGYAELETALGELAYAMFEADIPMFINHDYALQHIGSEALLTEALQSNYLETKGSHIRFTYKLLQDYFTAVGVKNEDRANFIPRPRLTADGRRVADKWDMVKIILIGLDPHPETTLRGIAAVNPFLALECIASGVTISASTVHLILSELQKNIGQEDGINRIEMVRILATIDTESALAMLPGIMRGGKWELRWAATLLMWDIDILYFEGLVQALENLDDRIKDETASVLRQLGKQVMPSLIRLLRHNNWKLRRGAAWGLGVLRDKAAVPGLIATLHDLDHNAAAEAADSLGEIRDPEAIPWLLHTLQHKHWKAKKAAAKALGAMGGPALNGLIATLNEGSEDSRRLVIEALKSIQSDSVTAILIQATYDESPEVRGAAIDALENQYDDEIIRRLIECLGDNTRVNFNRKLVADMAAEALERSGRPEALKAVQEWRDSAPAAIEPAPVEKLADTQTSAGIARERLKKIRTQETQPVHREYHDLTSANWRIRKGIIEKLAKENSSASQFILVKALKDEHYEVRIAALRALVALNSDKALLFVVRSLIDPSENVRVAVRSEFKSIGARGVGALSQALHSDNLYLCREAADMLAKIEAPAAVRALIQFLSLDPQDSAGLARQKLVANTLVLMGTSEAKDAVDAWQRKHAGTGGLSPNAHVRKLAVGDEDVEETQDILTELLEDLHSPVWAVRQQAAKALREYARMHRGTKDPSVMKRLMWAMRDDQWEVRWAAAEAAAWIQDKAAVPYLIELIKDPYWMVRIAAIRALLEIRDRTAAPAISRALADPNCNVREAAAEALGVIGDPRAAPSLAKALRDADTHVRVASVTALGLLSSERAEQALLEALHDENEYVRWMALQALTRTPKPAYTPILIEKLMDEGKPYWETSRICDLSEKLLERIGTPEAVAALENWRKGGYSVNSA